jgi:hypothetical protein
MNTTDSRFQNARRGLRAFLFLGLLVAALETGSGSILLYLYWIRLPTATIPAWRLWQFSLIYGAISLVILLGILLTSRTLIRGGESK